MGRSGADGACVLSREPNNRWLWLVSLSPPWPPRRRLCSLQTHTLRTWTRVRPHSETLAHTQALRSLKTQAPPVLSRCFFCRQAVLGPRSWLARRLRRHSEWLGRRSRIGRWYGVSRVLNRRQGGGGCCWAPLLASFRPSPGEPWCRLWCCCCCSFGATQCRYGRTRSSLIASAADRRGKRRPADGSRPVLQGEPRESRRVVLVLGPAKSNTAWNICGGRISNVRASQPWLPGVRRRGERRRAAIEGGRKLGCSRQKRSGRVLSCVYAWLRNEWASLVC